MTTAAELDQLIAIADGFGTVPMILTVDDSGRPRAAAVTLTWQDTNVAEGLLKVQAKVGHRSLANAQERPNVTLLWPAPPGERFALVADAVVTDATPDDDEQATPGGPGHARHKAGGALVLAVEKAILHQVTR